jgi:DNA-binding MarR family transcriptional regulator
MVSEGIVYRRADDTDRRRVLVYLSLHGRDLYERAAEVLSAAEAELAAARGDNVDLSRLLARARSDRVDALECQTPQLPFDRERVHAAA